MYGQQVGTFDSGFPYVWFIVVPLVALLLLGAALGIGMRQFLNGDGTVEKPNRVAQLYGYTVCLVAIITILFAISSLVRDAFTLADPLQASRSEYGIDVDGTTGSLTSFEAYRATHGPREANAPGRTGEARIIAGAGGASTASATPAAGSPPDTLTTDQQRSRYEALHADAIARIHFRALEAFTTSLVGLAIALVLFAVHWRWLRRLSAADGVAAASPV